MKKSYKIALGVIATIIVAIAVGFAFLCRDIYRGRRDSPLSSTDAIGDWEVDPNLLRSDNYRIESLRDFRITIQPEGAFTAKGVPPGLFLNKERHNADFEGTWILQYFGDVGYNRIDFTIKNLPGYTSGLFGGLLQWKDGHWGIGVGGQYDFIRLIRIESKTDG